MHVTKDDSSRGEVSSRGSSAKGQIGIRQEEAVHQKNDVKGQEESKKQDKQEAARQKVRDIIAEQNRIEVDEGEARKLLKRAKNLEIKSLGLPKDDRGNWDREIVKNLKEIVEKYPDTPSAIEAEEWLEKIEKSR